MMHQYGYSMMGGSMWGMGFFWILWIAILAFVFSAIFWLTYRWLVEGKTARHKER